MSISFQHNEIKQSYSHKPGNSSVAKTITKTCLPLLLMFLMVFTSCQKQQTIKKDKEVLNTASGSESGPTDITLCKSEPTCFWAGQTINAGSVVIANDNTNLYITVTSTGGFQAVSENLKIWVGTTLDLLPKNPQNVPIPGQFPYKFTVTGTTYTVTIPFADIEIDAGGTNCTTPLYVFVHGDVVANGKAETAWGGCTPGDEDVNRWYFYQLYRPTCCDAPPPPLGRTNTAFAKGGFVFTSDKKSNPENLPSLNLTKNRWGWAINLKQDGTTTYNLWAGAGLNTTSKGTLVGTVTIVLSGTNITVTYNTLAGYSLVSTHVYVGDDKPTTIAPGQYGNTANFNPFVTTSTGTYTLLIGSGDADGVWVIAHAAVNGIF